VGRGQAWRFAAMLAIFAGTIVWLVGLLHNIRPFVLALRVLLAAASVGVVGFLGANWLNRFAQKANAVELQASAKSGGINIVLPPDSGTDTQKLTEK